MSDERRKKAADVAAKRRAGASPTQARRIKDHMLAQHDLHTTCRFCQQTVRGTLAAINQHVMECGNGH